MTPIRFQNTSGYDPNDNGLKLTATRSAGLSALMQMLASSAAKGQDANTDPYGTPPADAGTNPPPSGLSGNGGYDYQQPELMHKRSSY